MTYEVYLALEKTPIFLNNADLWINLGFIAVIVGGIWFFNYINKKI